MSPIHVVLAWSAVLGCAGLLAAAVATAVGWLRSRAWLDRAILIQMGTALAASATGVLALGLDGTLRDPLHLMYGVIAAAGPLAMRYLVRNDPLRRIGRWMTIVGLIVGGVLFRSFMTGI